MVEVISGRFPGTTALNIEASQRTNNSSPNPRWSSQFMRCKNWFSDHLFLRNTNKKIIVASHVQKWIGCCIYLSKHSFERKSMGDRPPPSSPDGCYSSMSPHHNLSVSQWLVHFVCVVADLFQTVVGDFCRTS